MKHSKLSVTSERPGLTFYWQRLNGLCRFRVQESRPFHATRSRSSLARKTRSKPVLVPEQARLVRVPSVRFAGRMCRETVISQAPSWYTLPYVDDYPIMTFPTASLLFFLPLSVSLSLLSPVLHPRDDWKSVDSRPGYEWNFRSQFFLYGSFYGRQSLLQGGGEGWITEKTSGACITPISTTSLCYARSITANRIILSNEICERSMSIMLDDRTRSVPIRFFARKIGDGIYFSKKLLFFFENKIGFRLIDCTFDEYRRIFLCNPSLEISLSQRKRNLENQ